MSPIYTHYRQHRQLLIGGQILSLWLLAVTASLKFSVLVFGPFSCEATAAGDPCGAYARGVGLPPSRGSAGSDPDTRVSICSLLGAKCSAPSTRTDLFLERGSYSELRIGRRILEHRCSSTCTSSWAVCGVSNPSTIVNISGSLKP